MLYYTQSIIKVNGTGLFAESASFSYENANELVQGLGFKGQNAITTNGPLRASLSINYVLELDSEPIYEIINSLKNTHNTFHYEPIFIQLGDISGAFYLDSINYKVSHSEAIRGSANFVSFVPIGDNALSFSDFNSGSNFGYGFLSQVRFAQGHYNPVLDFEYNFKVNWQPIYTLGRTTPRQVQLTSAEESLSLTHEYVQRNHYTGANYPYLTGIEIKGTGENALVFPVSGMITQNANTTVNLEDVTRISMTAYKIY